MFLIPFLYKKIDDIQKFLIFLDKGTEFIEIDESMINEFCEINEIYFDNKIIKGQYCYLNISSKTDLKNFYTYTENSDAECWRRFILFDNDVLHINSTNPEFIQSILKNIIEIRFKTSY